MTGHNSRNIIRAIALLTIIIIVIVGVIAFWEGRTLWDALELAVIPFTLILIAFFLDSSQRDRQNRISKDDQQESALQEYLDRVSNLLIEHKLKETNRGDEKRAIARSLTITTLRRLDGERKGSLLLFLKESGLIQANETVQDEELGSIIDSDSLDLSNVILVDNFLVRISLCWAKLTNADLQHSILNESDMRGANLSIMA